MVSIRPAIIDDVYALCNRLRKQDTDEVMALVGLDNKTALELAFNESDKVFIGEINGLVVCMFGVSKINNGGSPWLLGSDEVNTIPITFIRESRKYINDFVLEYGYLENYVDARNTLSIQWLKWLGFKIEEPVQMGVEGRLFSRFTLGGGNDVSSSNKRSSNGI